MFVIGLTITLYFWLKTTLEPRQKYPAVVSTYPNVLMSKENTQPYKGEHPSRWKRPKDDIDYPIEYGEIGPSTALFAGPNQYPFACMTESTGLGQPSVDNHDGWGIPVYQVKDNGETTSHILGYSKDCGLPTTPIVGLKTPRGSYYTNHLLKAAHLAKQRNQDKSAPYPWFHGEIGTINRYLYSLIVPTEDFRGAITYSMDHWNGTLIYYFQGGVSIGFRQGSLKVRKIAKTLDELLQAGYAVATSTANATSSTYDIWLAEDSLMRVIKQFSARYGTPQRIIGVGGSGGAIQQYLISQNHPGLLDAGVALYSYPDMVTQIPSALDCELLEYYFDRLTTNSDRWSNFGERKWIQGMNSEEFFPNRYRWYQPLIYTFNGNIPTSIKGASTCSQSWRGTADQFNNPNFNSEFKLYSPKVRSNTNWTHWENLKRIYGTNSSGYAHSLFDNQGVQYGLKALKEGRIDTEEFLDINAKVGGWLAQRSKQQSRYWVLSGDQNITDMSLWSEFNMTHLGNSLWPAPRSIANTDAIAAAYHGGMIFTGKLRMPVIDLRHYLDDQLDMHYSWASFSIRKRIQQALGQYRRQVIWMTQKPHLPLREAVEATESWLENSTRYPKRTIEANRPDTLKDRCYDQKGQIIAEGPKVWNGPWNEQPIGPCLKTYPSFSSSRQVAGDNLLAYTLKCQLISVRNAVSQGVYAPINMQDVIRQLETIFPDGVCDFQQPGLGVPTSPKAWPID